MVDDVLSKRLFCIISSRKKSFPFFDRSSRNRVCCRPLLCCQIFVIADPWRWRAYVAFWPEPSDIGPYNFDYQDPVAKGHAPNMKIFLIPPHSCFKKDAA